MKESRWDYAILIYDDSNNTHLLDYRFHDFETAQVFKETQVDLEGCRPTIIKTLKREVKKQNEEHRNNQEGTS